MMVRQKFFLITFVAFFAAFIVGLGAGSLFPRVMAPVEWPGSTSPVPLEHLAHPVMRNLSAKAEGKVVAKTERSFTLSKNGDEAEISVFFPEESGITVFSDDTGIEPKGLRFADVRIGDEMSGRVIAVMEPHDRDFFAQWKRGDLIAQLFGIFKRGEY